MDEGGNVPAWSTKGTVLIACNCDYGCPCNFNARPSRGDCEGGWNWFVEEGRFGDVPLDGLGFSLFADWPGAIHEGGGVAVGYVDERADDAQREALTTLLRGSEGGPWGIFVDTYSLQDVRPARYEVDLAGHASRMRIGEVVDLELEPIRNPVTGAEVHPEMVLPEGLIVKWGGLAASKVFWVRDGLSFDHSGQYAAFGPFEYTGP